MATLTNPFTETPLRGAPYIVGDPIWVELAGYWRAAVVTGRQMASRARFGLRWELHVTVATPDGTVESVVRVDDNGRNHTYRGQILPRWVEG